MSERQRPVPLLGFGQGQPQAERPASPTVRATWPVLTSKALKGAPRERSCQK